MAPLNSTIEYVGALVEFINYTILFIVNAYFLVAHVRNRKRKAMKSALRVLGINLAFNLNQMGFNLTTIIAQKTGQLGEATTLTQRGPGLVTNLFLGFIILGLLIYFGNVLHISFCFVKIVISQTKRSQERVDRLSKGIMALIIVWVVIFLVGGTLLSYSHPIALPISIAFIALIPLCLTISFVVYAKRLRQLIHASENIKGKKSQAKIAGLSVVVVVVLDLQVIYGMIFYLFTDDYLKTAAIIWPMYHVPMEFLSAAMLYFFHPFHSAARKHSISTNGSGSGSGRLRTSNGSASSESFPRASNTSISLSVGDFPMDEIDINTSEVNSSSDLSHPANVSSDVSLTVDTYREDHPAVNR